MASSAGSEPPEPAAPQGVRLPPSITLAWGLENRAARGPRRGLTLDSVVNAGIKVALTEGLAALSMGRVARELGVGTMSLYRYVAAKDDLLTLMFDAGMGPAPALDPEAQDWREGLTIWAEGVRAAYRRHPWVLRVPISAPPLGPNNVAWLDAALRALTHTPLSEQEKLSTVLLVSGFVRNEATLSADLAAGAAAERVMPTYGAMLEAVLPPTGYAAVRRAIASGALSDGEGIENEFDFGLLRILDGIDALIREYG